MQANGNLNTHPSHGYRGALVRPPAKPTQRVMPRENNPITNMVRQNFAAKMHENGGIANLSPQAAKEILNDRHLKLGGLLSGVIQNIANRAE